MPKLSKSKLAENGTKIMSMAKKIRRANPKKVWKECVAAAGKLWRGENGSSKTMSKTKPKTSKSITAKKVKKVVKRRK